MLQLRAVVAGRRGGSPSRRPARASRRTLRRAALCAALAGTALAAAPADGQTWRATRGQVATRESGGAVADSATLAAVADSLAAATRASMARGAAAISRFRSARDSVAYETTRAASERDTRRRVVVSLLDRELYVIENLSDTLLVADVAIGVDTTVTYGRKTWRFETPRGRRTVLRKEANPVWIPPEWHYVEVAAKRNLRLAHLRADRPVTLLDGTKLVLRNGRVGLLGTDGLFTALPADEEIVFDGTLFVPPLGSANRRIPGELGRFKMELGDGYMLHGTRYENTVGTAATHGCVRLYDEDIEWLYTNVPAGTPVYIF